MPACSSCGAEILWAKMLGSGSLMPLDVEQKPAAVKLIAFNPRSGGGLAMVDTNLSLAERLGEQGVTFHEPHWATCPGAARHRAPQAESLPGL